MIWTRLAPHPLSGGGMPEAPVALRYRVCRDAAMRVTVRDEQVTTDADAATLHHDAGLPRVPASDLPLAEHGLS